MSVKIKGTFRVINCRISYEFGISELLLRTNEFVDMSTLYTYNILIVKQTQISARHIYWTHTTNFRYV